MRLLGLAIRALFAAAIGMVLWLIVTTLVEVTKSSYPLFVGPLPRARFVYDEYARGEASDDVAILEPRGISPEALEVLREIIGDHISAGLIADAVAVINQVKDDPTKDFLRLHMVRKIFGLGIPAPPSISAEGSKEVQDRISLLQNWITFTNREETTFRKDICKLATGTVSMGSIPQTGSISAIYSLAQGNLWDALNLKKQLEERTKTLPLFRKELADKLAAREAAEQTAKQAKERAEREEKLKAEVCIREALPIAQEIGNDVYKAEAFRRIANAEKRIDPDAAKKSLEKAVAAALNAPVEKREVNWWNHPWLWVIGSTLLYLLKPTGDAYGQSLVPLLQGLLAWLVRRPVVWLIARPPLAWAVGRNGKAASNADNGISQQLLGPGIPSVCTMVDDKLQRELAP